MKILITFLWVAFCLFCIGVFAAQESEESPSGQTQSAVDSVRLDVPPSLIDFTPDGRILAVEGESLLRLYTQDGVRIQKIWQLRDETVVDLLGSSPSFIVTNKNIYTLDDDSLRKFVTSPITLSAPQDWSELRATLAASELLPKMLPDDTDLGHYLSKQVSIPYPQEKPVNLLDLLKQNLRFDFQKVLRAAQFANKPAPKILTSIHRELVTLPFEQTKGMMLFSERFHKTDDSLTPNILSHIPVLNNLSIIKPTVRKENFFILRNTNELFYVDHALAIERLPLPETDSDRFLDLSMSYNSSAKTEDIFLLERNGLWQKSKHSPWEQKLQRKKVEIAVDGLLPDEEGEGVLIAGDNLGNFSLVYLSPNGQITPYATPAFEFTFRYDIGGGNNALIGDKITRIWIRTPENVYWSEAGLKNFTSIQENSLNDIWSIKRYLSKIWVHDRVKGLWVIEEDEHETICRQILEIGNIFTSANFPLKKGESEHVWIGGQELFAVLDEDLTEITIDYLNQLKRVLGISSEEQRLNRVLDISSEEQRLNRVLDILSEEQPLKRVKPVLNIVSEEQPFYVFELEPVKDALFVLTSQGLAKAYFEIGKLVIKKIGLPEMDNENVNILTGLVTESDEIFIASFGYDSTEGSKLWRGSIEDEQFQLVDTCDFNIYVLAETAQRKLLIGGNRNHLYTLVDNQIVSYKKIVECPIPEKFESILIVNSSNYVILAGNRPPFCLYSVKRDETTNTNIIIEHDVTAKPWKESVKLSDSRFLLLHRDGTVSLLALEHTPIIEEIQFSETITKVSFLEQDAKIVRVYLLGEQHIGIYVPEENKVKENPLPLPFEEKINSENMSFSVDTDGIWLGTENGLWRYDFMSPAVPDSWLPFFEQDGLPSSRIEAVIARNHHEAVVFTQAGLCQAEKAPAGYWRFSLTKDTPGILGTEVHKASAFLLDNRLTLALGTDKGLSIVYWQEDDWEKQQWRHFDQDSGLLDNDVVSLHWNQKTSQLWVGYREGGINILTLSPDSEKGPIDSWNIKSLTLEDGLPKEEITGIRTSEDGEHAWIMTKDTLSRWRRHQQGFYQLVHNEEPFFLQNAIQTKLAPSVDGQPPRMLVRDKNLDWSVRNPAAISVHPKLIVKEWFFFWYTTQLTISSLDPTLENPNLWDIEYRIDRIDIDPLKRSWGWLLDLWKNTGHHYVIASVKLKENPSVEYRATAPIPGASQAYRLIRLFILFLLLCVLVVCLFWYNHKRRIRARRLRDQEIPYIQGEAIQDASHFFGRGDLLTKLQNTIPTTNYALVGEFRIGKTSIQFRLKDLLKSLENPKYTFLTVFIDLQLLRLPRETYFFYFLGTHLIELAQEYDIPSEIFDEFHIRQIEQGEDYTSIHLKNDLEVLFEYLEKKYPERPPIILFQIDEITLMNDYDTLLKLRALLIREPRFKVILSGRNLYKESKRDTVSPWWNIFQEIEVEPLTPSEGRKLIVEPVKGLFQFDDEAIEHIIARSQGMPLAIQTMCANVLHYKYNAKKFSKRITKDDLYASLDFTKEQEDRQEEPTPDPSQEGNVLMGEQQPTPAPSQEGNIPEEREV